MPRLETVDELMRVHQEKQRSLESRRDSGPTIYIGMGTCGIAAGARDTLRAIQTELARHQLDARVTTVGCIGICIKEPLVDIQRPGEPRITYANVRPDMIPRLIEEHLVQCRPVPEWVIGQMPGDW